MTDQAHLLRDLMQRHRAAGRSSCGPESTRTAWSLAITSGKGGVGKTTISLNLGIALAERGLRVCVWDLSGAGNLDLLCGMDSPWRLDHVATGARELSEVLLAGPSNVSILVGSGLAALEEQVAERSDFASELKSLWDRFDLIVIDGTAPIDRAARRFLACCDSLLAVTTPDPIAITATYAAIKCTKTMDAGWSLLVNRAETSDLALEVTDRLQQTARLFLGQELKSAGFLLDDPELPRAALHRRPVLHDSPHCQSSRSIVELAARIARQFDDRPSDSGMVARFLERRSTV